MDLEKNRLLISNALKSNETMTIYCECEIKYSGRAEAELEKGERIIIIKSDNTLLIHQDISSNPINYMKNDSDIKISTTIIENEKVLLINSYNQKYKDYLDILITKVFNFFSRKLEDGKKLVLVGTEKDMSDMIKDNPLLISKDFNPLSREEHTKFGFIDVFGHDNKGNLIIIECKRYVAGVSAVQQLRRYVEKIVELKGINPNNVKGLIAAPEIAQNAKEMLLKWGFEYVKVEPPKRLERFNKNQKSLGDF
ncbi:MAG: endonuclease NucS [Candidatus Woesearchaeota archaeon]